METYLFNGIIIYGLQNVVVFFEDLINKFSSIWKSNGFVDVLTKR